VASAYADVWAETPLRRWLRWLDQGVREPSVDDLDQPVTLLTPEGERVTDPRFPLEISAADIKGLYRDMVLIRRIDDEGTALQRQGELGIWASCRGQEAAQVGSARALRTDDMAFPTYREHGVAWLRGVDLHDVTAVFRGASNGGWDPHATGTAHYMIVIGDQCPHAVGYAMGIQRDGADSAALVYFGDGATSQGDVHESFVFSSVFRAPVVFFCQNNQWAISHPQHRQSTVPLYRRAHGYGFPGVRVDGNDVLAVLAVTRQALEHARAGGGPTLIEAHTYRMGAHTTSDDPTRYRDVSELETWKLRDPIERVKAYLARTGAADRSFFEDVDAQAADLGRRVREVVTTMSTPTPDLMFQAVYAETHPVIESERALIRRLTEDAAGEVAGR
jgi:2-oxoisovalerate dehydrogenase E1 component alpha subunit